MIALYIKLQNKVNTYKYNLIVNLLPIHKDHLRRSLQFTLKYGHTMKLSPQLINQTHKFRAATNAPPRNTALRALLHTESAEDDINKKTSIKTGEQVDCTF